MQLYYMIFIRHQLAEYKTQVTTDGQVRPIALIAGSFHKARTSLGTVLLIRQQSVSLKGLKMRRVYGSCSTLQQS